MNPDYQHALRQIDELIAHFHSKETVSCAIAEQEDQILIRLGKLKHTLKPEDTQAIEHINRYYQRHINMNTTIKPGIYRHYKGALYEVSGTARHSETEEELVVYRALYGDYGLWVRPAAMFAETVEINGKTLPRFSCIKAF